MHPLMMEISYLKQLSQINLRGIFISNNFVLGGILYIDGLVQERRNSNLR